MNSKDIPDPESYFNDILSEDVVLNTLHQSWQKSIDKGCHIHIIEVTATYCYSDNYRYADTTQPGFWMERYMMPFEKQKMLDEIKEWKEYMEENMDTSSKNNNRGEIKFEKKKIRCKSVNELYS